MMDLISYFKVSPFLFFICMVSLLSVLLTSGNCKKISPCGKHYFLTPRGEIHSPNYPRPYPSNISCTWIILTPPSAVLTLLVKDIDIQEGTGCADTSCCNWLSLPIDNGYELLCGHNRVIKPRHIFRKQTVIRFFSSETNTSHRGFFLSYFFTDSQKTSYCLPNEFRCGDGKCLPGMMRCDRVAQCPDSTDEVNCQDECISIGKVSCGPQAVPDCFDNITQRCDGIQDCMSGRDEISCENIHCDKKCHTGGNCYSLSQKCDNTPHCPDYTDEIGCVPGCENGISCDGGNRCFSVTKRCDSQVDCLDGSDEQNCPEYGCLGDNRLCNNAKCLHYSLWCDGNNDCGDNSDEDNCIRNSVISATIMGCLLCGLLLVLAVLCTLRIYTKRTMTTVNYGIQLPPHIASRLNMTHSISLPALIDDEYFHREPPPAYSVAVGESETSLPVVPAHTSQTGRRQRARRHRPRPVIKPPTPPPSSETSNQSSPSRDSITSSSYLSNDDNVCLIDA